MKISVIIEINNLDPDIRNAPSVLKKNILKFIRPAASGILRYHNLMVLNIIQGYELGLVTFMVIKIKITSQIHLICFALVVSILKTCHFLIHFTNFLTEINICLKKVTIIDGNTLNPADAN